MFSIVWKERVEDVSGRTGVVYVTRDNNQKFRVCNVSTWGMGSCAVATLQSWGWMPRVRREELDKFFEFLCSEVDNDWQPNEFYFLFSDSQKRREFNFITQHPNVRLRDKFANKSHGPNRVYLYRYSQADDFKRVITKRVNHA